jgi:type IV pilus assembly protein PilZ
VIGLAIYGQPVERRHFYPRLKEQKTWKLTMAEAAANRPGVLSLSIKDKNVLYASYMPFISNGGLFIPTNRDYEMGAEVLMSLSLMEETERIPVVGKVVWKTPIGSIVYRACGIGIQFSNNAKSMEANERIKTYLGNAVNADRPTRTM